MGGGGGELGGRCQVGGGGVWWRVASDGRGGELGGEWEGGVRWRVESDVRGAELGGVRWEGAESDGRGRS